MTRAEAKELYTPKSTYAMKMQYVDQIFNAHEEEVRALESQMNTLKSSLGDAISALAEAKSAVRELSRVDAIFMTTSDSFFGAPVGLESRRCEVINPWVRTREDAVGVIVASALNGALTVVDPSVPQVTEEMVMVINDCEPFDSRKTIMLDKHENFLDKINSRHDKQKYWRKK